MARRTGGEYHHAGTAEKRRSVYQTRGSRLQVVRRETELTGLTALLAGGWGNFVGALAPATDLKGPFTRASGAAR
ncbi:MAG: hypothetical protein JWP65_1067 [Ramlibacter sp.]|uniref:hypothetical protein n=1 Tax=Ramlibacter sp. TaxID=1917967 RepID=UPI002A4342C5|nr:hypothetical protein [Ramlibacter sp.]